MCRPRAQLQAQHFPHATPPNSCATEVRTRSCTASVRSSCSGLSGMLRILGPGGRGAADTKLSPASAIWHLAERTEFCKGSEIFVLVSLVAVLTVSGAPVRHPGQPPNEPLTCRKSPSNSIRVHMSFPNNQLTSLAAMAASAGAPLPLLPLNFADAHPFLRPNQPSNQLPE